MSTRGAVKNSKLTLHNHTQNLYMIVNHTTCNDFTMQSKLFLWMTISRFLRIFLAFRSWISWCQASFIAFPTNCVIDVKTKGSLFNVERFVYVSLTAKAYCSRLLHKYFLSLNTFKWFFLIIRLLIFTSFKYNSDLDAADIVKLKIYCKILRRYRHINTT